jgi:hypothetical protein
MPVQTAELTFQSSGDSVGFEVDILEREESYKRRVNRLLTIIGIVVLVAVAAGIYVNHRQAVTLRKAEEAAAESKRQAEIAAMRAAYSADSASAHTRLTEFMEKYHAEKTQGAPLFLIDLPANRSVPSFLQEVWDDYAQAVDPDITDTEKRDLFRLKYIDAMNLTWYNSKGQLVWKGEHRPHAIIVPELRFKVTEVEMMQTSFPQVARAQVDAGLKLDEEAEEQETGPAPPDSTEAAIESLGESTTAP